MHCRARSEFCLPFACMRRRQAQGRRPTCRLGATTIVRAMPPRPPCRNLSAALPKTLNGGLSSSVSIPVFGGATISASVTIDCTGHDGIVFVAIDSPDPNAVVILRGLNIYGYLGGNSIPGIQVQSASQVTIENCRVSAWANHGANSVGILFAPSNAARLSVVDTVISANGDPAASVGGGIVVRPRGSGSGARGAAPGQSQQQVRHRRGRQQQYRRHQRDHHRQRHGQQRSQDGIVATTSAPASARSVCWSRTPSPSTTPSASARSGRT